VGILNTDDSHDINDADDWNEEEFEKRKQTILDLLGLKDDETGGTWQDIMDASGSSKYRYGTVAKKMKEVAKDLNISMHRLCENILKILGEEPYEEKFYKEELDEEKEQSIANLRKRRKKNKGNIKRSGTSLRAGSPMYYYCKGCAEEMGLLGLHSSTTPIYCTECKKMKEKDWL